MLIRDRQVIGGLGIESLVRQISSSLQFTRDVVPDPMGVGSSLTVGSSCEEMAARAEDDLNLIMDG